MKFVRIATTLLLQMAMITTVASQQPSSKEQKDRISSSEEREARVIAADFIARFEDSADIKQLMNLYTPDFTQRLRSLPNGSIAYPIAVIESSVIGLASDDELLASYTESTNFMYLVFRHYGAAEWLRRQSSTSDVPESTDLTFSEVLPAKVVEVLRDDPILGEILRAEEKRSARENQTKVEQTTSEDNLPNGPLQADNSKEANPTDEGSLPPSSTEDRNVIKTISDLRNFISTLERANALMRNSAKSLITMKALMEGFREQSSKDEKQVLNPRSYDLANDWFGYSAGERLICIDVLFFHMDLVKVHGRLQVASIYLESGCGR